jgi:tripartite-type tricarboxylate transporter receptor subunit TctC
MVEARQKWPWRCSSRPVVKRMTDLGAVPVGSTPRELAAFQRAEQDKWGKVIERGKIKPD